MSETTTEAPAADGIPESGNTEVELVGSEDGANVAPAQPDDAEDQDQPDPEADEESNPNKEAAKWRHRYRDEESAHKETQTALESATTKVEALQRQQIEAMLTSAHVKPAALWATTELGALLAEDGTVDPEAVKVAVDAARNTLGIQPLGKGIHVPRLGQQPDQMPEAVNAWTDAFSPKPKR